jgi:flavin reductase
MDLRAAFIEGMSRAATFVAVATTDGEGGRFGVTVSSLTSVSADGEQPLASCCASTTSRPPRPRSCRTALLRQSLGRRPARGVEPVRRPQRRRPCRAVRPRGLGKRRYRPAGLSGATAAFECRLATALLWETHHIIVGRVASVRLSDNPSALLYGQRAYRRAIHLAGGS